MDNILQHGRNSYNLISFKTVLQFLAAETVWGGTA
jgi:hypothetical protein